MYMCVCVYIYITHTHTHAHTHICMYTYSIYISAGQRLIASKINVLYNICVYCVYLLCIYIYIHIQDTHVQYILENIYMY